MMRHHVLIAAIGWWLVLGVLGSSGHELFEEQMREQPTRRVGTPLRTACEASAAERMLGVHDAAALETHFTASQSPPDCSSARYYNAHTISGSGLFSRMNLLAHMLLTAEADGRVLVMTNRTNTLSCVCLYASACVCVRLRLRFSAFAS